MTGTMPAMAGATIKRYFEAGASAWEYWNLAMPEGGWSGWGWPQNSLVVVDPASRTYRLTQDYWLLRHVAGMVEPGARAVPVSSFLGFDDQLAFRNPDGTLVLIANNALSEPQNVRYAFASRLLELELPADSLNTLRFRLPSWADAGLDRYPSGLNRRGIPESVEF